jgi:tetratricopeptide (TPR) repeat protein
MRVCNSGWLIVLGWCVVCTPAAPQAGGEDEAAQHYTAAHQAQDAGNLNLAAREYQEVIRLRPDIAEAYASLGLVYNAQGKYADSSRALAKAEKLKPSLPGVSLYLGIDYEKERQAGLAVPQLTEAVRLEPSNKQAHIWLNRALWDDGRTQAALEHLKQTSGLFPDDPALLLDLGEAYRKAADLGIARVLSGAKGTPMVDQVFGDIYRDERAWENALAHYYRALDQDPHWQGVHFGLGEIAFHREKLDAAAQEYHRELELNPASAAAMARLGEVALLQAKVDEGLTLMGSAIHISGYQAASALGLPRPYPAASEDLSEQAQTQLRNSLPALEAAPASAARSLALATVNARLGSADASAWNDFSASLASSHAVSPEESFYRQDFAQAASSLNAWIKLHPHDWKADYLLARTYRNLSLVTLEQLLATAPDSYAAHQLLAETYQNQEQDAKALEEYKIVAGLAPDMPGVHYSIGHLLLKTGQQDQAVTEFETELRANPDHGAANAELGTVLLNRQQAEQAIPYLQKALSANPDQWATYRDLGRAYYMQKDYAKAQTALQQAVRHDPEGLAHFQLALVYRSLGKKDEANAQFEIARKLKLEGLTHAQTRMNTLESVDQ